MNEQENNLHHFSELNTEKLREINRVIVSAVITSKDGKILMGKKDPTKGGVYPDSWHIPGGGVESDETLEDTLKKEVAEETGIDVTSHIITAIQDKGYGETEKTLKDTGEKVWCKMEFNRFEIHIDQNAEDIKIEPSDDLVELKWFSKEELPNIEQAGDGKEFFQRQGYIE